MVSGFMLGKEIGIKDNGEIYRSYVTRGNGLFIHKLNIHYKLNDKYHGVYDKYRFFSKSFVEVRKIIYNI